MPDVEPQSSAATEPSRSHPRRFWWLTRLAALTVLMAAGVGGIRMWWGNVAERRMATAIADAHARGERILVADFATTVTVSDDQNAAFYYRRAKQALKVSNTQEWALDATETLPVRRDVFDITGEALKQNGAALADVRKARACDQVDWNIAVRSPMWSVLLPDLNYMRQLARFTRASGIHAAQRGDHAAAIEHARDLHAIVRNVNQQPFVISHLVSVGIDAMAADFVAEITPDLRIADSAGADATTASREQVRAVIDSLLNDQPRRDGMQLALQSERAAQVDTGNVMGSRARLLRPSMQLDALRLVNEGKQLQAAARAPDWPTAQPLFPVPPNVQAPRVAAHVVSQSVRPALNRAVLTDMRAAAQSRLTAVALAIRLYQHDHAGQRPPTLDALVPDYLPAVPLDPFAAGGKPIRFIAAATQPYVYSVGENGRDNSGDTGWRPDATTTDPLRAVDMFLHLTRQDVKQDIPDPPQPEPDATTQPTE